MAEIRLSVRWNKKTNSSGFAGIELSLGAVEDRKTRNLGGFDGNQIVRQGDKKINSSGFAGIELSLCAAWQR